MGWGGVGGEQRGKKQQSRRRFHRLSPTRLCRRRGRATSGGQRGRVEERPLAPPLLHSLSRPFDFDSRLLDRPLVFRTRKSARARLIWRAPPPLLPSSCLPRDRPRLLLLLHKSNAAAATGECNRRRLRCQYSFEYCKAAATRPARVRQPPRCALVVVVAMPPRSTAVVDAAHDDSNNNDHHGGT